MGAAMLGCARGTHVQEYQSRFCSEGDVPQHIVRELARCARLKHMKVKEKILG